MRAYTARREMNRLRRNACRIWQSREVATVINKLEIEIEKLRLVIRKVFSHLESNRALVNFSLNARKIERANSQQSIALRSHFSKILKHATI